MTNEQREAIELAKEFTRIDFSNPLGWTGYYDTDLKELSQAIDTVLSLIKEQEEKIDKLKRDNADVWCLNSKMSRRHLDDICKLKQKDKQIDLMAELVYKRFKAELLLEYGFENEEQLKQYFADLVEKE